MRFPTFMTPCLPFHSLSLSPSQLEPPRFFPHVGYPAQYSLSTVLLSPFQLLSNPPFFLSFLRSCFFPLISKHTVLTRHSPQLQREPDHKPNPRFLETGGGSLAEEGKKEPRRQRQEINLISLSELWITFPFILHASPPSLILFLFSHISPFSSSHSPTLWLISFHSPSMRRIAMQVSLRRINA